ncbi:hypothetical protein ACXZ1M_03140 [Duganella sp. PWIR1]
MDTISKAFGTLLLGVFAWVMIVDVARALRSGVAVFRIGRWSGPWENPIRKLISPSAYWLAVLTSTLWALALSIVFFLCAIPSMLRLL